MKVWGISGGIATGKSAACKLLSSDSGIAVIDCDVIARTVVEKGSWGYRRVKKAFAGQDVFLPDGGIDRQKLGTVIFQDAQARKRLNKATHLPIMVSLARQLLGNWLRCKYLVVVDMPLLFEIGAWKWTSGNIVVSCAPEPQLLRLQQRDDISAEVAQRKIDAQMPTARKVELATYVLQNDGSLEDLRADVRSLAEGIKRSAKWHGRLLSPIMAGICLLAIVLSFTL